MAQERENKPPSDPIYRLLAERFGSTKKLKKGNAELDYVTGEQVITRLNEVLGFDAWEFQVYEHGELGEDLWVRGELTVYASGRTLRKAQYGQVTRNRGMADGDALKGAATDCLKKCATLIGVGLYLSHKEELAAVDPFTASRTGSGSPTPRRTAGTSAVASTTPAKSGAGTGIAASAPPTTTSIRATIAPCAICGEELSDVKFKDGTVWTPADLAARGSSKFDEVLCMAHYKEANEARKRAEAAVGQPAF